MSKNKDEKIALVEKLSEKVKKSKSIVIVDYRGVTVEQDVNLRKAMREHDIEYKVLKNKLMLRALKEQGYDNFEKVLEGPSAFAFSYSCPVTATKILAEKGAEFSKLAFKAGIVEGKVLDANEIQAVSKIPNQEILLTQLVSLLSSPMRNLAVVLSEVSKQKAEKSN